MSSSSSVKAVLLFSEAESERAVLIKVLVSLIFVEVSLISYSRLSIEFSFSNLNLYFSYSSNSSLTSCIFLLVS